VPRNSLKIILPRTTNGPNNGPGWSQMARSEPNLNWTGPPQPQPSMDRTYGQVTPRPPETCCTRQDESARPVSWWVPGPSRGGGQAIFGLLIARTEIMGNDAGAPHINAENWPHAVAESLDALRHPVPGAQELSHGLELKGCCPGGRSLPLYRPPLGRTRA
jgi:hypothetical protein